MGQMSYSVVFLEAEMLLLLLVACVDDVDSAMPVVPETTMSFPDPETLPMFDSLSLGGRRVLAPLSLEAEIGVRVLDHLLAQESESLDRFSVGVGADHYALLALAEHTGGSGELAQVDAGLAAIGRDVLGYGEIEHASGARGLFQIMPKTYERLVDRYPSADLIADAFAGRSDPTNALRAAIVHVYSEAESFSPGRRDLLSSDEALWRLVLTAGYNTHIARVDTALQDCGVRWRDASCESALPGETRHHLVRYEGIERTLYEEAETD